MLSVRFISKFVFICFTFVSKSIFVICLFVFFLNKKLLNFLMLYLFNYVMLSCYVILVQFYVFAYSFSVLSFYVLETPSTHFEWNKSVKCVYQNFVRSVNTRVLVKYNVKASAKQEHVWIRQDKKRMILCTMTLTIAETSTFNFTVF